jgi:hypothetical protein
MTADKLRDWGYLGSTWVALVNLMKAEDAGRLAG